MSSDPADLEQVIAKCADHLSGFTPAEFARHVVAAIRDSGYTVIATPTIDHLGPADTVPSVYRRVAWNLDNGYEPGGSNVKASVARTLRDIAAQHAGDTP